MGSNLSTNRVTDKDIKCFTYIYLRCGYKVYRKGKMHNIYQQPKDTKIFKLLNIFFFFSYQPGHTDSLSLFLSVMLAETSGYCYKNSKDLLVKNVEDEK